MLCQGKGGVPIDAGGGGGAGVQLGVEDQPAVGAGGGNNPPGQVFKYLNRTSVLDLLLHIFFEFICEFEFSF